MEQDLIRERYDLSMARIQEILTEETVPENYRDYFRKVTEFIIQCGEVLKGERGRKSGADDTGRGKNVKP